MGKLTTDQYTNIVTLLNKNIATSVIIEKLGLDITKRQIQRIAKDQGIDRPHPSRNGRIDLDDDSQIKLYVRWCLINHRELDPNLCAQCGKRGRMDVHHTKYEGATIYDLEFVCRRCNTTGDNVGLA